MVVNGDACDHWETIKVNLMAINEKNNMVKKTVWTFENGSTDDTLCWWGRVTLIIKNKPCHKPSTKFNIIDMVVDGDAHDH